jgi:hypothetical protein
LIVKYFFFPGNYHSAISEILKAWGVGGGGGVFCNKDVLRIAKVVAKMMPTFDVECESCIARLAGLVPGLAPHTALVLFTPHFFHHLRLKGQCHEIFASGFFMGQFPPSPRVSRKFAEIFASQGAAPVSTTI